MSANRRNKISGRFASRLIEMLESPAYRALSQAARRVLSRIEIEFAHHGGKENGKLPVTFKDFVECGIPRETIGAALAEAEALGFIEITERGKKARAAEYRRRNQFRLTTRPELEGVGPERCKWRRFETLEEAQAVADTARAKAVAGRKAKPNEHRHPNLEAAGSENEPITVRNPNRSSAFPGSESEPLRMPESEPLPISREARAIGVTGARPVAERQPATDG